MNLRYIALWLGPESGYDDVFRDHFNLHSRFISNYLSIQIRKEKFKTDGTFNMLGIVPKLNGQEVCKIRGLDALSITIPFDKDKYEELKEIERYGYYLELLEKGFKVASNHKEIPLAVLLGLINDFRMNVYKNEWQPIKKKFKEHDIEIVLDCFFTSFDFKLVLSVFRISTKEKLVSGTTIRTLPNEIYYDKMFKDIVINKDNIIVTDASDSPRVIVNMNDALNKKFNFHLAGDDKEFNKLLSYDGSGFPK